MQGYLADDSLEGTYSSGNEVITLWLEEGRFFAVGDMFPRNIEIWICDRHFYWTMICLPGARFADITYCLHRLINNLREESTIMLHINTYDAENC